MKLCRYFFLKIKSILIRSICPGGFPRKMPNDQNNQNNLLEVTVVKHTGKTPFREHIATIREFPQHETKSATCALSSFL